MEATSLLLLPHGGLRASPMHGKVGCVMKPRYPTSDKRMRLSSPVQAVMLRAKEAATPRKTATATVAATTTAYRDNWFDMLAIGHLSKNLQEASGLKNDNDGYESLIVATVAISRVFGVEKQCELVIQALQQAFPGFILTMIKMMMPPSRFAREYFAAFTTIFFPWLVGPCEVKESEVDGSKEKNVVYIPKCRFLESTNCVGMCTNLCKIPCQKFIQDSLGMDVYMSPNFEDMSCEMIFGQQPPEDDPTLKQPCFQTQCIAKQDHGVNCSI